MKTLHKIDLIFSVNSKKSIVFDVSNETVQEIAQKIRHQKEYLSEYTHKFKIKGA